MNYDLARIRNHSWIYWDGCVYDLLRGEVMPFKSEAQRRKFAELVKKGKMDKATFDEWSSDTPSVLPERIGKSSKTVGKVKKVKVK